MLSATIGVAFSYPPTLRCEQLLKHAADTAMYEASGLSLIGFMAVRIARASSVSSTFDVTARAL